jgi:hypothetical protein
MISENMASEGLTPSLDQRREPGRAFGDATRSQAITRRASGAAGTAAR